MTYGWAILIIIIVGAALYALGVFSPGTFTGKRSTGFSAFQMNDFKFDTVGNVTLAYGNRAGKSVTLNAITATYKSIACTVNTGFNTTVGPNTAYTVVLDCNSDFDDQTSKASYSVAIDFNYTEPDSQLWHLDSGTIFGIIE
jgi:hypothetical protein